MVDLGQKRWKRFHLFYFILSREKNKEHRKKIADLRQREFKKLNIKKDGQHLSYPSFFFTLCSIFDYLSKANLLATSVQLITLKKASI